METGETVTPAGTPVADDLNRAGEPCAACDRERDGCRRSSSRKADLGSAGTQRESGSRRGIAAADLAAARTGAPASTNEQEVAEKRNRHNEIAGRTMGPHCLAAPRPDLLRGDRQYIAEAKRTAGNQWEIPPLTENGCVISCSLVVFHGHLTSVSYPAWEAWARSAGARFQGTENGGTGPPVPSQFPPSFPAARKLQAPHGILSATVSPPDPDGGEGYVIAK